MNKETKIIRATLSGLIAGALLLTPAVVAQANNPVNDSTATTEAQAAPIQPVAGQPVANENTSAAQPKATTPATTTAAQPAAVATSPSSSAPTGSNASAGSSPTSNSTGAGSAGTPASAKDPAGGTAATAPAAATPASSAPTQSPASKAKTSPAEQQADPADPTDPAEPGSLSVTLNDVDPIVADKPVKPARPGQNLTGTVSGLVTTEPAKVALVAQHTDGSAPADLDCAPIAAAAAPTINCQIPADQIEGVYQVVVTQTDQQGEEVRGTSADFYLLDVDVYDPKLSGPTLPLTPGGSGSLTGSGFSPGSQVKISIDSFWISGGEETVDAEGNFSFTLKPGVFTPQDKYTVTVTDQTTGQQRTVSIYVLRATGTLNVSVNTGVEGGFSTEVSGDNFSDGDYTVDLKLYASDGSSVIGELAKGVQVSQGKLANTEVSIPASAAAGLYQVSATNGDARLSATWVAVFPKTKAAPVAPPVIIDHPVYVPAPVQPTQPLPPLAPMPPVKVPVIVHAPTPLPVLIHQTTTTLNDDPFGLKAAAAAAQLPNLNGSNPTIKPGAGNVSADPTPQKPAPITSTAQPDPSSAESQVGGTQIVQSSQDIWPLIWVGLIFILIGLVLGYIIALAGGRKGKQAAH